MRFVPVPGTGTFVRRRPSPRLDRRVADRSAAARAVASNLVGYSRFALGRIAQRESARFTRGRSVVRSHLRPSLSQAVARSGLGLDNCDPEPGPLARRLYALPRLGFVAATRDVGLITPARCALDLQAYVAEAVCPCDHHVEFADRWQRPEDRLKLSGLLRGYAFDRREAVNSPRLGLHPHRRRERIEAAQNSLPARATLLHGLHALESDRHRLLGNLVGSSPRPCTTKDEVESVLVHGRLATLLLFCWGTRHLSRQYQCGSQEEQRERNHRLSHSRNRYQIGQLAIVRIERRGSTAGPASLAQRVNRRRRDDPFDAARQFRVQGYQRVCLQLSECDVLGVVSRGPSQLIRQVPGPTLEDGVAREPDLHPPDTGEAFVRDIGRDLASLDGLVQGRQRLGTKERRCEEFVRKIG